MNKLDAPRTQADLDHLIESAIEESTTLEYKASAALSKTDNKKRDEISKDIAAFANSAGGVLIYGVQESNGANGKRLPEKITPVDSHEISREWLDQMIGQIQPRIHGLEIIPVNTGPRDSDFCYVIVIPQSMTAHQSVDGRYYRRRNFEVTWMEDYEIRDVMNRAKHPNLAVMARIFTSDGGAPRLVLRVANNSDVMARHFALNIRCPVRISQGWMRFDNAHLENEDGQTYWQFSETGGFTPLFPHSMRIIICPFQWVKAFNPEPKTTIDEIRIKVFADNMPPLELMKKATTAELDWI